jgi:hypothetical protein
MVPILLLIACHRAAGGEPNRVFMASVGLILVAIGVVTVFGVASRT